MGLGDSLGVPMALGGSGESLGSLLSSPWVNTLWLVPQAPIGFGVSECSLGFPCDSHGMVGGWVSFEVPLGSLWPVGSLEGFLSPQGDGGLCRSLDLTGPLLLGGVPTLPESFPIRSRHFVGCMRHLHIDQRPVDMSAFIANNGTLPGGLQDRETGQGLGRDCAPSSRGRWDVGLRGTRTGGLCPLNDGRGFQGWRDGWGFRGHGGCCALWVWDGRLRSAGMG